MFCGLFCGVESYLIGGYVCIVVLDLGQDALLLVEYRLGVVGVEALAA